MFRHFHSHQHVTFTPSHDADKTEDDEAVSTEPPATVHGDGATYESALPRRRGGNMTQYI
jgi:hypothetical protein